MISFQAAFVAGCVSGLGIIQDACVPHKNHRKHSGASGSAGRKSCLPFVFTSSFCNRMRRGNGRETIESNSLGIKRDM